MPTRPGKGARKGARARASSGVRRSDSPKQSNPNPTREQPCARPGCARRRARGDEFCARCLREVRAREYAARAQAETPSAAQVCGALMFCALVLEDAILRAGMRVAHGDAGRAPAADSLLRVARELGARLAESAAADGASAPSDGACAPVNPDLTGAAAGRGECSAPACMEQGERGVITTSYVTTVYEEPALPEEVEPVPGTRAVVVAVVPPSGVRLEAQVSPVLRVSAELRPELAQALRELAERLDPREDCAGCGDEYAAAAIAWRCEACGAAYCAHCAAGVAPVPGGLPVACDACGGVR